MSAWRFQRPPNLPPPNPAPEAAPFFEALKNHRLTIQHCASCGAFAHPPRAMCRNCQSTDFHWREVSGQGTVYSYVVTHQPVHPAFTSHTPLTTVEIELAEGPHLISNLLDVPPDEVEIGLPVAVVFEAVGDGVVLPLFRRAS